jgi:hypothetical protein
MNMNGWIATLLFTLTSSTSYAAAIGIPLPEPGVLELLGIAGVIALVLKMRQGRK